ncbi:UNVERIFIED_CONTAM: hypothetical protein FKN15_014873 [Acipenser sinensis]
MLGAVVLATKFILQGDSAVLCVSSRYRAVFYDPPLPPPRCLVHALRSTSMRYSKLRPLNPRCQLDLCRHESRYGCQREDNCSFAHSLVELKTWDLQKHTGKRGGEERGGEERRGEERREESYSNTQTRGESYSNTQIRGEERRGEERRATATHRYERRGEESYSNTQVREERRGELQQHTGTRGEERRATATHRYERRGEESYSNTQVREERRGELQQHTGISHEEIVQESKRHGFKLELGNHRATPPPLSGPAPAPPPHSLPLSLRMKFVCGQCWRDGQVSEPDRALRYCTARSKHSWTRERRVLLVTSAERRTWVLVRPLPFSTTFPQRYDLCVHILKYRKCHYIGSCSFAHSPEERDVWTYMKDNNMRDMQQMYELWLRLTTQNRQADGTPLTSGGEEKQIVMPTDYAEDMAGFHCRVRGKHSNGSRQWQEHISTEKHKEKLFITQEEEEESEGACWKHRFPGESFTLCSK